MDEGGHRARIRGRPQCQFRGKPYSVLHVFIRSFLFFPCVFSFTLFCPLTNKGVHKYTGLITDTKKQNKPTTAISRFIDEWLGG